MIVYGQEGKGKGKLGSSVYLINHGVQIKREYTGAVSNPSTPAQVSQRARFKLASQVSAALEPVIVIPRKGIRSPRNLFVQKNMGYFYGTVEGASVSYENLQITAGGTALPGIVINRPDLGNMTIALEDAAVQYVSHVVYCIYKKQGDGSLLYWDSIVVEGDEDNDAFMATMQKITGDLVVYAYGFKGRNASAKAKYSSYNVTSGLDVAQLVANRVMEAKDYLFTATRGTSISTGQTSNPQPGEGNVMLYITNSYGGSVSVKIGAENPIVITTGSVPVPIGSQVQLTATPPNEWIFYGWRNNGEQNVFDTMNPLSFVMNEMRDIVPKYLYTHGQLE